MWMSGEVTSIPSLTRSGPAELQLRLEPALRQHVDGVAASGRRAPRGYTIGRSGAVPEQESARRSGGASASSGSWRLLALLGLLGADRVHLRAADGARGAGAGARPGASSRCRSRTRTSTRATGTRCSRSSAATRRGCSSRRSRSRRWLKQAIVAIEDKRFYEHRGVDVHGILRALWSDAHGRAGAGRLDDHAAVRQEHDQRQRADGRAQAQGGGARLEARAVVVEGQDPDRLPEHDLLRQRRLRRRGGQPRLLRPQRGATSTRPRPPSSPASPRTRASTTRSRIRRPRATRRNLVLRQMYLQHYLDHAQYRQWVHAPMPKPETVHLQATPERGGAVLRELRDRPARRAVRPSRSSAAAAR